MSRDSSVLVSTDVAAMGLDVKDLNLSINIGKEDKAKYIREQKLI